MAAGTSRGVDLNETNQAGAGDDKLKTLNLHYHNAFDH